MVAYSNEIAPNSSVDLITAKNFDEFESVKDNEKKWCKKMLKIKRETINNTNLLDKCRRILLVDPNKPAPKVQHFDGFQLVHGFSCIALTVHQSIQSKLRNWNRTTTEKKIDFVFNEKVKWNVFLSLLSKMQQKNVFALVDWKRK